MKFSLLLVETPMGLALLPRAMTTATSAMQTVYFVVLEFDSD